MPELGKELTKTEFYIEACRYADSANTGTAAKWWQAFVEVITRRLYFEGSCKTPLLGTFGERIIAESNQVHPNPNGEGTVVYTVPEHMYPTFTPSDDFINDVNMAGVTKQFRKRRKKELLSHRDYLREIRAQSLNIKGSLSEEVVEGAQKEFKEKLAELRKRGSKHVDPEEE